MKLKTLINGLRLKMLRGKDLDVTGLCANSKYVFPGNLFIAKAGEADNGANYIEEAVANGAVVVLTDLFNPFLKDVVQLIHPDVASIEAELASRFYREPSSELYMVGVTGTSGKTTIAYLVKYLFEALGMGCGLIGTVEYLIGELRLQADKTTPDVLTNQKLLREMVRAQCQSAVMEVTSHGLSQKRVDKISFDAAIFTNLSHDHLDYHHTMEQYAEEKAKLFSLIKSTGVAIINHDSPWSQGMLKNWQGKTISYGLSKGADFFAHSIRLYPDKTTFSVTSKEKICHFESRLLGQHNVYNILAVLSLCDHRGYPIEGLREILSEFQPVVGRLERVKNLANLHIFVDYAHKPEALEKVLSCLHELKMGRIITVFGCGGDRDKTKRPVMGAIADSFSDFTIVTSDNPRSEDPNEICRQIERGIGSKNYTIEIDRRKAIEKAIEMASPNDLILIAGKGHETYQSFSHYSLPFDDREVAKEIANRRARV